MTPRPDAEARAAARDRLAALKQERDAVHAEAEKAKADADAAMWKAVGAELDSGAALQADAATALGFTRDHVAKQVQRYRDS